MGQGMMEDPLFVADAAACVRDERRNYDNLAAQDIARRYRRHQALYASTLWTA
ncbi:hypothetical protein LCGC14_1796270 [marine sediment metagenome]|uniref:Uncharacterized protein n=1 Tax=marine sediment metagenome TaxID=412755 RepID=A0A0F9GR90_9ZZZZ